MLFVVQTHFHCSQSLVWKHPFPIHTKKNSQKSTFLHFFTFSLKFKVHMYLLCLWKYIFCVLFLSFIFVGNDIIPWHVYLYNIMKSLESESLVPKHAFVSASEFNHWQTFVNHKLLYIVSLCFFSSWFYRSSAFYGEGHKETAPLHRSSKVPIQHLLCASSRRATTKTLLCPTTNWHWTTRGLH